MAQRALIGLWKYNRITGYWQLARMCEPETADQWLMIWKADSPGTYTLARRRPKHKP